jgi:hypothetical protein
MVERLTAGHSSRAARPCGTLLAHSSRRRPASSSDPDTRCPYVRSTTRTLVPMNRPTSAESQCEIGVCRRDASHGPDAPCWQVTCVLSTRAIRSLRSAESSGAPDAHLVRPSLHDLAFPRFLILRVFGRAPTRDDRQRRHRQLDLLGMLDRHRFVGRHQHAGRMQPVDLSQQGGILLALQPQLLDGDRVAPARPHLSCDAWIQGLVDDEDGARHERLKRYAALAASTACHHWLASWISRADSP